MNRRAIITALAWAWPALAGPPLTTIQDVLYKADGSRFNGTAVISWDGFEATDLSYISPQSVTVKIVDGNFRLQLVPNAAASPAVYYNVRYVSDAKAQFVERWLVPMSVTTLRVRDVRVATGVSSVGNETGVTTVTENDVIGLTADLAARPLKGAGYLPGRVAMVNAQGALESVTGSASDCVRVDGSSGPCGSPQPAFIDSETPGGLVDGTNATFTLASAPVPAASVALYRNGILLKVDQDYTLSGQVVTFVTDAIPQPEDTLLVSYRTSDGSASVSAAMAMSPAPAAAMPMFRSPQVLCSGTGTASSAGELSNVGTCSIAAGTLAAGGRIQVWFDFAHTGSAAGFDVAVKWGATTVAQRTAPAAETLLSGRADVGVYGEGAQASAQTWGAMVSPVVSLSDARDAMDQELVIGFYAQAGGGDAVALRSYTVVRLP